MQTTNRRHFQTTTSTMVEAALWAKEGAPHLALVTADEQTAARGRQGKAWSTFPGHCFAGTYILTENTGPHLPLIAGVALTRALKQFAPTLQLNQAEKRLHDNPITRLPDYPRHHLALKWPNDVLLEGKKLAGILVEHLNPLENPTPKAQSPKPTYLLGIGLNLTPPKEIPEGFPGTFLSQSLPKNTIIPLEDFIKGTTSCISEVLQLYGSLGWPALAGEYVRQCCTIGQTVTWHKSPEVTLTGLARGLDETGALELVDEAGVLHRIHSGDVIAQGRSR